MAANNSDTTNFLLGTPGYFWDDNSTAITLGILGEINEDEETVYYNVVGIDHWFDHFSAFSEPVPYEASYRLATLPIKVTPNVPF